MKALLKLALVALAATVLVKAFRNRVSAGQGSRPDDLPAEPSSDNMASTGQSEQNVSGAAPF